MPQPKGQNKPLYHATGRHMDSVSKYVFSFQIRTRDGWSWLLNNPWWQFSADRMEEGTAYLFVAFGAFFGDNKRALARGEYVNDSKRKRENKGAFSFERWTIPPLAEYCHPWHHSQLLPRSNFTMWEEDEMMKSGAATLGAWGRAVCHADDDADVDADANTDADGSGCGDGTQRS